MQALMRVGHPDDIASVVAFLASDAAGWITGETVHVDGGSKLCETHVHPARATARVS